MGLGAFSGGAVRYRIYTAAGLAPGQIARVIGFISVALGIGLAAIAGLGLILRADQVSQMLGTSPGPLLASAATILILATIFLIFCAARRRPVVLGPVAIEPPGPVLVLTQIALTVIDVLAAAAVLWALLPPTGIGYFAFAAVYAAALALGVLSHVPGGLGVFEIAILYAVGGKAPVSHVAAALVAYRAVYYLLPLFLSTVLLAGFEARRSLGREVGSGSIVRRPGWRHLSSRQRPLPSALPSRIRRHAGLHRAVPDSARPWPLWTIDLVFSAASPGSSFFLPRAGSCTVLMARRGWHRRWPLLSIPFSLVRGLAIIAPTVARSADRADPGACAIRPRASCSRHH